MDADLTGRVLDGTYEIRRHLFAGRWYVLYEGWHLNLRQVVLVEVPRRDSGALLLEFGVFGSMAREESKLAGSQGLPRMLEVTRRDEGLRLPFVVRSWEGEPLNPGKLTRLPSFHRIVAIGRELATTLARLHAGKHYHGALVPPRVVLPEKGPPKLIGYGAMDLLRQPKVPAAGASSRVAVDRLFTMGELRYLPPEQLGGGSASAAADVYGMGAVLYALLTGRAPYGGKSAAEVRWAQQHGPHPDVAEFCPNAPPSLMQLVQATLSVDAARRPTAGEVVDQLCDLERRAASDTEPAERQAAGPAAGEQVGNSRARYPLAHHILLRPRVPSLDFGLYYPGKELEPQTFVVEVAGAGGGWIECAATWLEVTPREFSRGETEIHVMLRPDQLPGGGSHEAVLNLVLRNVEARVTTHCRVRRLEGVDLVCIVDAIGDEKAVEPRRRWLEQLLAGAESALREYGELRVALLAYADFHHWPVPGQRPLNPLPLRLDFTDAAAASVALRQLPAIKTQDFEAALEEALIALAGLCWRPAARHVLVSIGNRPPHPKERSAGGREVPSPSKYDWREVLHGERRTRGLLSFSVYTAMYLPAGVKPANEERYASYAATCWRELGYSGASEYLDTPAGTLLDDIARALGAAISAG